MITLPAPDPKREREQATAELRRQREGERRKSAGTVLVPDASGGDPIPWE